MELPQLPHILLFLFVTDGMFIYCSVFMSYNCSTLSMLTPDQIRLISCLLAAVPLSYLLSCLPPNPKKLILFNCFVSVIMQIIVFQAEAPMLWLQQAIVYLLCKYTPRRNIGNIVLIQTFAALILVQLLRMYLSYGEQKVDITAIFMMQTFLYIGFAFNYQDGADPEIKTERAIVELPSVGEYMGFVLFIPSCLVGPVFEYNDYSNYLYRKGIYSEVKPGFSFPAIKKQLKTFVCSFAIFIALSPFNLSFMLTPEYANMNFFVQAGYLLISIMGARFKYYSAWSLGMVGFNATGLTYNPEETPQGRVNKWDKVVVSNIKIFELDPSMKMKADSWNIPIQLALKRYIYDRQYIPSPEHTPKQKKKLQIIAQQKTLAVSALWHGLYPGYFVSFFHWALLLQVSQELFRIERESEKLSKWRKNFFFVELIVINYFLGYFGVCFQLMSIEKIMIFFRATHFIPVVMVYLANLFVVRLAVFSHKKGNPIVK